MLEPMSAFTPATDWLWDGERPRVTSVFQPIIDVISGHPIGMEVLSRGPQGLAEPHRFFARAREEGRLWDLELACLTAAAQNIALLPLDARQVPFFLNVSPESLRDARFQQGAAAIKVLERHGLEPRQVVLEITETGSFGDAEELQEMVRHLAALGFGLALDDFGAGHSGLVTLVNAAPHFIKLDRALVREIHRHSYRQHLVKALVAFAGGVDAQLIAEGVETWEELRVLLRLGIRYAQGYLVARPAPRPPPLSLELEQHRAEAVRALLVGGSEDDERVGSMVIRGTCVPEGSLTTEELDRLFRNTSAMDHVVFVQQERPVALVTRQLFYARTSGPFGYPLLQKKPAELTAQRQPLVVQEGMSITALAKVAMERPPEHLYEPVVVTDEQGRFQGTVTMKQLIGRATELEVREATGANPLTQLPGNRMVERWVRQALATGSFSVIYADLDHFKAYNDRYGFLQGDRLIRFTARLLAESLHLLPAGTQLGHVGGDDFVLVCPSEVAPEALRLLCQRFDEQKAPLFDRHDLERGWFEATDREGASLQVPPVTLSLAVLDGKDLKENEVHPAALSSRSAALKKRVKQMAWRQRASAYLVG
jgi:EAL domain-containing protein (putative c-di-GMP-specific phosphodiesterase class I)/GGDEF domain-containing protein